MLQCFPALNLKSVSCFKLVLDAFLRVLLRNNGTKQLLIVFIAPILNKLHLCICLIYFLFRIFSIEANIFANASQHTVSNLI